MISAGLFTNYNKHNLKQKQDSSKIVLKLPNIDSNSLVKDEREEFKIKKAFNVLSSNKPQPKSKITKQASSKTTTRKVDTVQNSWQQIKVKSGDNLTKIFRNLKINSKELHNLMAASKDSMHLAKLKPGQQIDVLIEEQNTTKFNNLKAIKLVLTPIKTLEIKSYNNSYKFNMLTSDLETTYRYKQVQITDSLYQSGKRAGVSSRLLSQLVNIFSWDIDFALDIRKNDTFKILFEEKYANGKKVKSGNIVAAEFVNNGRTYKAILYKDNYGAKRYYSPDGYSMQKAFIRTPVQFTRISSKFSLGRKHPILHKIRAHRGVDYAAPTGTPVKATGNARVAFIGRKGGYGKCIFLKHGKKYTTVYGHLSRFAKLKKGSKVRQGQVIGYVGKTGSATGPHLHYEFRVNGVHKDPLKVKLPKSEHIPKHKMQDFKLTANKMLKLIDTHKKSYLAQH